MSTVVCLLIVLAWSHAEALDKACPFKPADLIFVLDGSGSEGSHNFRKQLEFVSNFTSQFEIGPNNTRVSLLTYATDVQNQFFLNQFSTKPEVFSHINRTHYPNGETNTHLALQFVQHTTLARQHDGRNATKIVIVLTDGQSLEPAMTKAAANALKANPLVEVIAIGIGDRVDPNELRAIATDRNHTFQVSSFDALETIQAELTSETCNTCKYDLSDICFVLDSSGSEGSSNFLKQLEFVNLMANEFEINGSHGTQICVVTFGTQSHTDIRLNSFMTKDGLIENVLKIPYRDGETRTDLGLSNAYNELFGRGHNVGARQGSNKVAIVLTDGRSTEPEMTQHNANNLQRHGTDMFAIGIGHAIDGKELDMIASDHDHVFTVHSFEELDSIHQNVLDQICAKSSMTTLPPTTPTTTTTTTTLPPTTTKAACGLKPADIVFVIDSSDSEGPDNFKTELEFVYKFAAQFSIGASNVQFSVVTFSSSVRNDFYFNTYNSRNAVLHAIRNIDYMGQGTNTSEALKHVRVDNLQATNGARANATKFVIVITDGRSDNPDETKKEAALLHHTAEVIAVGIGPAVDKPELAAIASNHRVVQVDNFALLHNIQQQLTDLACENGQN